MMTKTTNKKIKELSKTESSDRFTPTPLADGIKVSDDPFLIYKIENFLQPKDYESLRKAFPNRSRFTETVAGNKMRLNSRNTPEAFEKFLRHSPVWEQFINIFTSDKFLTELHSLARPHMSRSRGFFQPKTWRNGNSIIGKGPSRLFPQDIRIGFEFSRLERGSSVVPHTDAPEKLASMSFFFPEPDWRPSYGGGTIFYRPKNPDLEYNWFNRKISFDQLIPVHEFAFEPNYLLLFLKSRNSYHGVPPIKIPKGKPRNSLNISIIAEPYARFQGPAKIRRRLHKKWEQRFWRNPQAF